MKGGVGSDVAALPVERLSPVRLPEGVRDYLPRAAARRRAIADAILDECERWGYRRIITPAFEYEAVLARGLGQKARAETVRFVEPSTGEVVALRPDITPQVARLVATRLAGEPGPIRLGYEGSVVRLGREAHVQRELFQAGAELVDAPQPAGDVEVIALSAAALEAAGLERFTLDVGEVSVVRAALGGLDGDAAAALERAVARKDQAEVERQARALGLPAARRKLVAALPSLYGDPSVIDRALSLIPAGDRATRAGLATLSTVVARLQRAGSEWAARLTVDLGEVRGWGYYTGIRFQGFAPGVGDALLSGGRYDHLIERYGGPSRRAAGFAVDVERVALALRDQGATPPAPAAGLLVAGAPEQAATLAAALRRAGARAVAQLDDGAVSDDALRAQAAREGLPRVLVLNARGARWLGGHPIRGDLLGRVLDGDRDAALDLLGETSSSG